MTEKDVPNKYINASKKDLLDEYRIKLESSGLSESMVNLHLLAAKALMQSYPVHPASISIDDMERIESIIRKRYSKRTSEQYLPCIGHFIESLTGRNIWIANRTSSHYKSSWFDAVKHADCHLEIEVVTWVDKLKDEGHSDYTCYELGRRTRICIQALGLSGIRRSVNDYTIHDLNMLNDIMSDMQNGSRERYIRAFSRFLTENGGLAKGNADELRLQEYGEHLATQGLKDSTIASKKQCVTSIMFNLQKEFGRRYSPSEIDAKLLNALVNRTSYRVKESSMNLYVRGMLDYLDWWGKTEVRGNLNIHWNKNYSEEAKRVWITIDELKKIASVASYEDMVVLTLGAGMGIRLSEIANIKIEDINGDELTIHGKGHGTAGKTVSRIMPRAVKSAILDYLPVRQKIIDRSGDHSGGYLLVRSKIKAGFPMNRTNISSIISRLREQSGVYFTCHSLRRLFATTAYEMTDLETLRQMMRHSNISTTFACYINVNPKRRNEATDAVCETIFGNM